MAMIERRRRGGAVIVPENIVAGAKIAPSLLRAFKQWYDSSNQMSTSSSFQNISGGKQSGNRKKQSKQQKRASGNGSGQYLNPQVPRGVKGGAGNSVRFVLKDVVGLNNVSSTGSKFFYPLANVSNTTGGGTLGEFIPRFNTLAGLYRQFVINKLVVRFVPNQAFTAAGSIALGIDTSPLAGAPNDYGQVVHHNPSMLIDVKSQDQIVYVPTKNDPRYTNSGVGTSEDELSYGVLQYFSTNNLGLGNAAGLMWFELDVTLMGPT